MTTERSSPATDEMGETARVAHVEAVYVLAPRVRAGEWLGHPWEPRTVAMSTPSRIFEREGSPWAAAAAIDTRGGR
jgi:hypothetical protein